MRLLKLYSFFGYKYVLFYFDLNVLFFFFTFLVIFCLGSLLNTTCIIFVCLFSLAEEEEGFRCEIKIYVNEYNITQRMGLSPNIGLSDRLIGWKLHLHEGPNRYEWTNEKHEELMKEILLFWFSLDKIDYIFSTQN